MFAVNKNKFYPNHTERKEETVEHLAAGIYEFDVEESMFFSRPFFNQERFREGLIDLKGQPFDSVKRRLTSFFKETTREIYRDTQTRHFIGCMLYGPPGTGKTCFIDLICQHFAQTCNAITLRITDNSNFNTLGGIVKLARSNDDSRMVILLMEELDKIMHGGYGNHEKCLIDFCDGQNTPSNVLLLASTNHIDKVPDSLKNRPSRFSIAEEIDAIPTAIAKQLIEKFVIEKYRNRINIDELAYKVTEDRITIDQVKYIVLNMLCDDLSVEEAILKVTTKIGGVPIPDDEDENNE